MKIIKLIWLKFLNKRGFKRLTNAELKMMNVAVMITEEYIHSRKFRRAIKDTKMSDYIEQTLKEWNMLNDNEIEQNEN